MGIGSYHGIDEHACQAEWNALGVLFALHRHLKAIAKVNVDHLACRPLQHQVGRMPGALAKAST